MRHPSIRASVVVLIVAGLVAFAGVAGRGGLAPAAWSQEATPGADAAATPEERPTGAPLIERLGCGLEDFGEAGTSDGAAPAVLEFNVVTFGPGDAITTERYRQPVVAYVLYGQVDLEVVRVEPDGRVWLRTEAERALEPYPWKCREHQTLERGTFTLTTGDAVFLERADYTIRNQTSGNAVLMTAVIDDADDTGLPEACNGGCPKWP